MTKLLRTAASLALLGAYAAAIFFFGPEVWSFFRATYVSIVSIFPGV